jgi:hypothetical protein
MWNLSTQIFGQSYFSYETLASAALEEDVNKIKMAVQRINILTIEEAKQKTNSSCFDYDIKNWKWNMAIKSKKCVFLSFKDIEAIITKSKSPIIK